MEIGGKGGKGRETHNDKPPRSLRSHRICRILVRESQIPVRAREAAKGADEGREDEEEDDVGAEGADEEDEADETCGGTGVSVSRMSFSVCVHVWTKGWDVTYP